LALFLFVTLFCLPSLVRADTDTNSEVDQLSSHLLVEPDDHQARLKLARLFSQAGRYDDALVNYDRLIRQFPADVDYSFARAQVLSWLGRDREAIAELERARKLAPDYEDVWRLQLAIMERRHRAGAREELDAFRQEAATRFPNSTWTSAHDEPIDYRWQMTLGGAYEQLSGNRDNWNSEYFQLDWNKSDAQRYFGRMARDVRFDNSDTQFVAGGQWRRSDDWTFGAEINTSPGADFLPESGFAATAERPFGKSWVAGGGYRQRRFENSTVSTYSPSLQRYLGDYRLAYSFNLSHLHGQGNSGAHVFAMDWYTSPQSSVRLTLSDGDEIEAVGAGQVLETSVRSATVSGAYVLNKRLKLTWWLGKVRQGDYYRRTYAGMAFTVGL
jgi:YaiO family outer membrane protein